MKKLISLNEKIFIAGASGMVGSAIKRALLNKGYGNYQKGGEILSPNRKELNLLDNNLVKDWFKKNKPTVVILAAAKVGGILANTRYQADFILENLKIQNNIIENSWKNGVKRLLFLGSSCIYPRDSIQPIKEEYLLDSKLEPTNEGYAIAKISGIKLCQFLREQYGFDAISLMPTNLYGTGDNYHPTNSHVFASLIRKFSYAAKHNLSTVTCWGTGSPYREFMHVDDLAEATIFVLEKWSPSLENAPRNEEEIPFTYLNVGTGKDITIKELAKKISTAAKFKGDIIWDLSKPDGTPRKMLDSQRILALGWKPIINLDIGIQNTIDQYLKLVLK